MKFLIIDDEHELYKIMYADMYRKKQYDIEEISNFKKMNKFLKSINKIHFSRKINYYIWLPFKNIWNKLYTLNNYKFLENEEYWIIILNGTLCAYYSEKFLQNIKKKHPNIKLAMIMYDSVANPYAKRSVSMLNLFDKVFSFDIKDCEKYKFEYIYSTLSYPDFVEKNNGFNSEVFFVGSAFGRLELLHKCIEKINEKVPNSSFYITGVNEKNQIEDVIYNKPISYAETLNRAFNTKCLLEVVKPGQTGITLRTCEAILFNKKLITNNKSIKELPFYNPQYMSIFESEKDLDIDFITSDVIPNYNYNGCFSPLNIIKKLTEEESEDEKDKS